MREGRFSSAVSEIAQRYSESVSFDRRLYHHDIAGSIAHASALASAGIVSADEFEMIARGLREIENEIARGLREIENEIAADKFVWDRSLEDVHMNIEAALTKRIGAPGAKLHSGRSRNDQIALDLRLYVREEIDEIITRLRALQNALLLLAQKNSEVLMPATPICNGPNQFISRITCSPSSKHWSATTNDCAIRVDVPTLCRSVLVLSPVQLSHSTGKQLPRRLASSVSPKTVSMR